MTRRDGMWEGFAPDISAEAGYNASFELLPPATTVIFLANYTAPAAEDVGCALRQWLLES